MRKSPFVFLWLVCIGISGCKDPAQPVEVPPTPAKPVSRTLCYMNTVEWDTNTVVLNINGNAVTGRMDYKSWYDKRPSLLGTLSGTLVGDTVKATWDYAFGDKKFIERTDLLIEEKRHRLHRRHGGMKEENGVRVYADPKLALYSEVFLAMGCPKP